MFEPADPQPSSPSSLVDADVEREAAAGGGFYNGILCTLQFFIHAVASLMPA